MSALLFLVPGSQFWRRREILDPGTRMSAVHSWVNWRKEAELFSFFCHNWCCNVAMFFFILCKFSCCNVTSERAIFINNLMRFFINNLINCVFVFSTKKVLYTFDFSKKVVWFLGIFYHAILIFSKNNFWTDRDFFWCFLDNIFAQSRCFFLLFFYKFFPFLEHSYHLETIRIGGIL